MATTVHGKLTYEEFQDLPREDGRRRLELIEGEVFVTPSPNTRHQRAVGRIFRTLSDFVEEHDLGEVFIAPYDVVFSRWTALEPDLLFIRKERSGIVTDANVQGAPDLVVEVLSPSNRAHDRERKLRVYEAAGVPELWYLDPSEKTAEILNLDGDGRYAVTAALSGNDAIVSTALPGLFLGLNEIFAS